MRVDEALATAVAAEGVTAVFGMMGDANARWMQRLGERGVEVVHVRHEGAGLAMADGWARMTGVPGVCTTTGGPGCAQLATTALAASRARTPLVAFCGDVPLGDDQNAQHLDQARFAAAIEAGFVRLTSAERAHAAIQRAFYRARIESRPIILSMPVEVKDQELDDDDEYVPSASIIDPSPIWPEPDAIERAAELVAASERPVLLVGRGAMRSGAGAAVRSLADRLGAVVATTLMAKNWLNDYPYHVGVCGLFSSRVAIECFAAADCVIAAGASLNIYTTESGYLFPAARFVQFDTRPHLVMGDGRAADCYVESDARPGLEALDAALARAGVRREGFHRPELTARLASALDDPASFDLPPGTLDPRDVVRTLDAELPAHVGMILGGGQQNHFGIMLCNKARDWLLPNLHFAAIGQGLTTAIGAVIAMGRRPGFLMEGDAGFLMHLAEFETAVRYRVPLLVVVMNDEGMAAEYHSMHAKGVDLRMTAIPTPDLGRVADAMGGRGSLCRTLDELRDALRRFVADPAPSLVDVRIARNVPSIPNRRRFYGLDA
ncbi:MAG TPA: thiamine pyrophosphate-binding protein [Acidimicrobiales bacterium]|nr:thiamine pyrophosphate-binding protein [Acidimicrobiales bacterium]